MPRVSGNDGRAELDARHLAARHRQRGQRVKPEDLRHPGRREPVVGRPAELISQLDYCLVAACLRKQGADPHALSPSARRQARCRLPGTRFSRPHTAIRKPL